MIYDDEEERLEWNRMEKDERRKWKWYICSPNGRNYALPDTSAAVGYDQFGVHDHRLSCRPVRDDDIVSIFPELYIGDPISARVYMRQTRFVDIPDGYVIHVGRCDGKDGDQTK
jgi:hypothetical protein